MFEHFEHPFQKKSSIFWGISISGMKIFIFVNLFRTLFSENIEYEPNFISEIEIPQKIKDFGEKVRTCVQRKFNSESLYLQING